MKTGAVLILALLSSMLPDSTQAQLPTPPAVESPNVNGGAGLPAQQFQEEMNVLVEGVRMTRNCCHLGRHLASEEKPEKLKGRQMPETTKAINQQFYPDYKPQD